MYCFAWEANREKLSHRSGESIEALRKHPRVLQAVYAIMPVAAFFFIYAISQA
jgi:hypothetical protein